MRKPVVDYRKLRLSNIASPTYRHLLLLVGWPIYFTMYALTESLIPEDICRVIHCPLDDVIPFCEWFILPYFGWYLLVVGSLLWFLLYDVEKFKKLQTYIMITQAVAVATYILWPSRQELRPETFPRESFLTWLVSILYFFDTPTGVFPSLHVAYSIGIASCWLREEQASAGTKVLICAAVALVCVSVMFVKQHSALDIVAAFPVCLLAEVLLFGRKTKKGEKTYEKMGRS